MPEICETPFAAFVRHEVAEQREQFPCRRLGLYDGYALLLRELSTFVQEVWKGPRGRLDGLLLIALFQLAGLCQIVAEDCGLISPEFQ